jgi:hypothetical protein
MRRDVNINDQTHYIHYVGGEQMVGKIVLSFIFATALLLFGFFVPASVLLNMPFGLFYYLADKLGWWHSGLMWVVENRLLSLACFFACPIIVSLVYGILTTRLTYQVYLGRSWKAKASAGVVLAIVFVLLLAVRIDPNSYTISYFGYWTSNY